MCRRRLSLVGVVAVVTACAGVSTEAFRCAPSVWRSSPPLVIAHAGGEGLGPSNTIEAMERSLAVGADLLDVDLRMTRDGVIVARHDRDVASSTDGSGYVDELTWAEMRRLDAAATWSGEPFDGAVRVPSLQQVLARFPDAWISLELKQVEPSMARPLCDLLRRTRSLGRVYVSSNEDSAVYAVRDACPEGLLITTTYADLDRMRAADEGDREWCATSPIGQPPFGDGRLDQARIRTAHRRGMAVFAWTVDDPAALRELADAGVDGVYTRRPDVARQVFDTMAPGS
jgi:glycerophosphoryl diester phosphodiesterase